MSIIHDALKKAQFSGEQPPPSAGGGGGFSGTRRSVTVGLVVAAVFLGALALVLVSKRSLVSLRSMGGEERLGVGVSVDIPARVPVPREAARTPAEPPPSSETLIRQGQRYFWLGDFEMAGDAFREALSSGAGNRAELLNNLGLVLRKEGALKEALGFFDDALGEDPKMVAALSNRSVVYRRLGRYDDAVADLGKALEIKPDHAHAQFNLGTVHEAMGNPRAAVLFYRKYLDNPSRTPGLDEALIRQRISSLEAGMSSASWPNAKKKGR